MAISVPNDPDQPADEAVTKSGERRALSVACGAHVLHDGYTNLIWIALPIWQAEFGLSYAAVGLLRMIYSGTMAGLQIPASYIAGRVGGRAVLAAGTGLCGLCYCLGLGHGYWSLVATLFLGGLGATTQHPIGSALVTRVFTGARALTAFGTYNFAGDAGKVLPPASATMLMLFMRSCLRMSAFEGKADIARTCGGQKAPEFDKEKGVSLHHHCVLTSCLINRGGFLMRMHNLLRRKSFCIAAAISCTLAAIAPAPAQSDIELQNVTAVSGIVTGNVQEVGFRAMIQKRAIEYNLAGSVENNKEDKSVRFILQGDKDRIDQALKAIRKGTKKSSNVNVSVSPAPAKADRNSFTVVGWTSVSRHILHPYNLVFNLRPNNTTIKKGEAKKIWLEICKETVTGEDSGKCKKDKKDKDDDDQDDD